MSDIYCAKCGEPWDSYGINRGNCNRGEGDVTGAESERFHKGEGCPSCGFGTRCPSCNGTGAQSDPTCPHRCGNGKLLAWSPQQNSNPRYQSGVWYFGYAPNVKEIPEGAKKLRTAEGHGSRDGWVNRRWYSCPHCIPETGPKYPCDECKGDGKLHRQNKDDLELRAAESAIEASDEEPIGILAERGM